MQNIQSGDAEEFQNTGDVDPVAEADVYMAYSRHEQAEEILLEEIKKRPDRLAALFKLANLYSETRDTSKFRDIIAKIKALSDESEEVHLRAAELEYLFDQHPEIGASSQKNPTKEVSFGILADQGPTYIEQVATNDLLYRNRITTALAKLLTERVNTQPISIGLFGPWGSGKSSQISFLRQHLAKNSKNIRVSIFNAWEYEHAENMGAALAQTVVEDLLRNLGLISQLEIATKLTAEENHKLLKPATRDANSALGALIQWSSVLPSLLIPATLSGLSIFFVVEWISNNTFIQSTTALIGTSFGAWLGLKNFLNEHLLNWIKKNQNQGQISKYLGLPDFRNKIGVHYEIRTALSQMCKLCIKQDSAPENGEYLLLVIDDLDRCSPATVKSTLDAVRLVANIQRIVTLVAIDPRIAYSAAIKHFEQFTQSGRPPELIARDYLGKVFQVAITLPNASKAATRKFIYEELFHGRFQSDSRRTNHNTETSGDSETADELIEQVEEFMIVHENLQKLLPGEVEMFSALTHACSFSNPRQLWRLKQAWQLMKGISFEHGLQMKALTPWMRALFLCEYILQSDPDSANAINSWLNNKASAPPDILVHLALGEPIEKAFADYLSRAEVVSHVLLPAASK